MRTVVIHNVTLQIGSNRAENDRLFHQALDHDIWFHIDQHPSAHMLMPGVDKSNILDKKKLYTIALQLKKYSRYKSVNSLKIRYAPKTSLQGTSRSGTLLIKGKSQTINV